MPKIRHISDCDFEINGKTFHGIDELKKYLLSDEVNPEQLLSQSKTEENAISQQKPNVEVLRNESEGTGEGVGLSGVGESNTESEITTKESEEEKSEIANDNMDSDDEYVGLNDETKKANNEREKGGVEFDAESFGNKVALLINRGETKEDIVDFYKQYGFELSDEQKSVIDDKIKESLKITPEDEQAINDFEKYLQGIKFGKKISTVAKRLSGVAAVNKLTDLIEGNKVLFDRISHQRLMDMANNVVDYMGTDAAIDFLNNQKANDPLVDLRTLMQARLFNDLLKEGRREEAAEIWTQMARQSTVSGRNISSIRMAYDMLGAGNIDAQFKKMAYEKMAEKRNDEVKDELDRINNELGEKGQEAVKQQSEKSAQEALKNTTFQNKVKNFIDRICKRKR